MKSVSVINSRYNICGLMSRTSCEKIDTTMCVQTINLVSFIRDRTKQSEDREFVSAAVMNARHANTSVQQTARLMTEKKGGAIVNDKFSLLRKRVRALMSHYMTMI